MTTETVRRELSAWADAFAASVRSGDIDSGRALFHQDVVGFGTRQRMMADLDALVEQQWRHIWSSTRGFQFDLDDLNCGASGGSDLAWLALSWRSEGRTPKGVWFPRTGRATFILEKADGVWLCRHSHHSLDPAREPLAAVEGLRSA